MTRFGAKLAKRGLSHAKRLDSVFGINIALWIYAIFRIWKPRSGLIWPLVEADAFGAGDVTEGAGEPLMILRLCIGVKSFAWPKRCEF